MIRFTQGNLLEAEAEALVNTVNTVGIMGRGIALMFKERFPDNMRQYAEACKADQVRVGSMFVTEPAEELMGPKWIVNFPTKQHWRNNSKIEWIEAGLEDLRQFILDNKVATIAIPPLGAGNGGLDWQEVKPRIEKVLGDLTEVDILVFEPTEEYQNVGKQVGVEKLTPARALIAELVRRYWILGIECSLLEIQKLAWFLQRVVEREELDNPLSLDFKAENYGPYASNLSHLLNDLDGSYLKSNKRIPDCSPLDVIWFNDSKKDYVNVWLHSEAKEFLSALERTSDLISGFESPFGLELLSTVDWLLSLGGCEPTVESVRYGLETWPAGPKWAKRKQMIFGDNHLQIALDRLAGFAR